MEKISAPSKRKDHGPSHGMEEPAFHALQREDGHERGNGDDDGVEHRALDFVGSEADALGVVSVPSAMTHMAHNVFDQYDGAFDHHAEVQCAQREQVGGDMHQVRGRWRQTAEQREWSRQR